MNIFSDHNYLQLLVGVIPQNLQCKGNPSLRHKELPQDVTSLQIQILHPQNQGNNQSEIENIVLKFSFVIQVAPHEPFFSLKVT